MPRTHRPYPPEFRAEAVRLARGSDKAIPVLAAALGVSSEALRHWLRQADADAGHGQPGDLTSDEREELRRLRREVKTLQQEREIPRRRRRLLREGDLVSRYRFIRAERASYPVTMLCRVLGVACSAYYAWARRGVSAHAQADATLAAQGGLALPAHRAGPRRARHGPPGPPPAARPDPPYRPQVPVHGGGLSGRPRQARPRLRDEPAG